MFLTCVNLAVLFILLKCNVPFVVGCPIMAIVLLLPLALVELYIHTRRYD